MMEQGPRLGPWGPAEAQCFPLLGLQVHQGNRQREEASADGPGPALGFQEIRSRGSWAPLIHAEQLPGSEVWVLPPMMPNTVGPSRTKG